MANSSYETFKQGGKAIDEAAEKTGQAVGAYEQAKSAASGAYDSAADFAEGAVARAGDAMGKVQEGAADLDEMVSEQVGRHPKAMVALSIGIGFVLGMLFANARPAARESRWY